MQWSPFQSQNWIWSWDQRFYFLTLCQNEATKLAKNKFRFSRAIAYSYISISFANVVIMFKPFDRWCQTHWCHILKRPPWQAARGGRRPYLFFFLSENNHSVNIIIIILYHNHYHYHYHGTCYWQSHCESKIYKEPSLAKFFDIFLKMFFSLLLHFWSFLGFGKAMKLNSSEKK